MLRQRMTGENNVLLGYIVYSSNGIRWVSAELNHNGVKQFTNSIRRFKGNG